MGPYKLAILLVAIALFLASCTVETTTSKPGSEDDYSGITKSGKDSGNNGNNENDSGTESGDAESSDTGSGDATTADKDSGSGGGENASDAETSTDVSNCQTDRDCPSGFKCNADGICQEVEFSDGSIGEDAGSDSGSNSCQNDDDCPDGFFCNEDMICENSGGPQDTGITDVEPPDSGDSGLQDSGSEDTGLADTGVTDTEPEDTAPTCSAKGAACGIGCCAGLVCNKSGICVEHCSTAGCAVNEACNSTTGLCDPIAGCTGDSQCPQGQICSSGNCIDPPPVNKATRCEITTPPGVIHEGQTQQFHAIAYSSTGDEVVGQTFTWTSSNTARAFFTNPNSGILTGGTEAGETSVTAQLANSSLQCANSVTYTNYTNPPANTFRIIVRSSSSGSPISGATVLLIRESENKTATTDASGTATFTDPPPAKSVSVFAQGYTYVTVISPSSGDLYFSLDSDPTANGGMDGTFDYSHVTSSGSVYIGLAGLSITSGILDFAYEKLFGDFVDTTIQTIQGNTTVPLPESLELRDASYVMTINKNWYHVASSAGLHAASGLGGRFSESVLISIGSDLFGGGQTPTTGQALGAMLRLFNQFSDHTVEPNKTVTSGANINLNMSFNQPLSMQTTVNVPQLPKYNNNYLDGALVYLSSRVPDMGLTAMGINSGTDAEQMSSRNGMVDPPSSSGLSEGQILVKFAPNHGGIEGSEYVILIVAEPVSDLGSNIFPALTSTIIWRGATVPSQLTTAVPFLGFAAGAKFTRSSGAFQSPQITGGDMIKMQFERSNKQWVVYAPNDGVAFNVPAPATGFDDRRQGTLKAQIVDITAGMNYQSFISFSSQNMDDLLDIVERYSTTECASGSSSAGCAIN